VSPEKLNVPADLPDTCCASSAYIVLAAVKTNYGTTMLRKQFTIAQKVSFILGSRVLAMLQTDIHQSISEFTNTNR